MRIALAQINTVVGDVGENSRRAAGAIAHSRDQGATLTLLPELVLGGYPPEDLLLRPEFAAATRVALDELARSVTVGAALVGFVEWDGDCHNALAVVADGRVQAVYRKRFLPNYGVFDEARYFAAGTGPVVIELAGLRVGLSICEDIWYATPVAAELAGARLDLVCNISASPYHRGKADWRERMLATRAADCGAALAFCNLVGGQDELVFDGRSAVFDAAGTVVARAAAFEEEILIADLDLGAAARHRLREPRSRRLPQPSGPPPTPINLGTATPEPVPSATARIAEVPTPEEAELWAALCMGIRDYVDKNGFAGVVIGLSGGIDSALTAALAADAVGGGRMTGVAMPSRYSSPDSLADAQALATGLGADFMTIKIDPVVTAFEGVLAASFAGTAPGVAEENLQARARGTILMALSNKHGGLVLATGNKSEMSVGYSTLYGDMVGGFAPLRDVSKTWVYRLSVWRNASAGHPVIPERSITRAPSAELRPDQLDSDTLPEYAVLDRILERYIEQDDSPASIAADGCPRELVDQVVAMVDRAEYKRRQGPVGIKVTPRALGRDRRMPITSRYGHAR